MDKKVSCDEWIELKEQEIDEDVKQAQLEAYKEALAIEDGREEGTNGEEV